MDMQTLYSMHFVVVLFITVGYNVHPWKYVGPSRIDASLEMGRMHRDCYISGVTSMFGALSELFSVVGVIQLSS